MQAAEAKLEARSAADAARQAAMELARTRMEMQEENERRRCLICMDRTKCVIALPCGHGVACRECGERLQRQLDQPGGLPCPMCRDPVASLQVIYMG